MYMELGKTKKAEHIIKEKDNRKVKNSSSKNLCHCYIAII